VCVVRYVLCVPSLQGTNARARWVLCVDDCIHMGIAGSSRVCAVRLRTRWALFRVNATVMRHHCCHEVSLLKHASNSLTV
jgi:hypothetical protein